MSAVTPHQLRVIEDARVRGNGLGVIKTDGRVFMKERRRPIYEVRADGTLEDMTPVLDAARMLSDNERDQENAKWR